jgi:aminopeptidase-like protein
MKERVFVNHIPESVNDACRLITRLYPICRSVTGDGLRETLRHICEYIPLEIIEVPSGTPVFDWHVPREWNIRDGFIKNSAGRKIVDFQESNLHVVNYSIPIHAKISLTELKKHLHSLPDHPDWIPYKTSYYKESWGFCLSHNILQGLEDGQYEVCIDADLKQGHLTYGEFVLSGESEEEVLFSCHICHPSLCNDNLSGIAVAVLLAQHLMRLSHRRYTYRFLFLPGTIGAITWLSRNGRGIRRIRHGVVLTGLGDSGPLTYKKSRRGDARIDKVFSHVLRHLNGDNRIIDFSPYGYDERQYCSPGINLPVGRLSRTPFGEYPEYHTSADNLDFIKPSALAGSLQCLLDVVHVLETNAAFNNLFPWGEPQLGRRGLYEDSSFDIMALLWVLNLSDGGFTLLDIAERSGMPYPKICQASEILVKNSLLEPLETKEIGL